MNMKLIMENFRKSVAESEDPEEMWIAKANFADAVEKGATEEAFDEAADNVVDTAQEKGLDDDYAIRYYLRLVREYRAEHNIEVW